MVRWLFRIKIVKSKRDQNGENNRVKIKWLMGIGDLNYWRLDNNKFQQIIVWKSKNIIIFINKTLNVFWSNERVTNIDLNWIHIDKYY